MRSIRIQVLVEPEERARMRAQAQREGKSLSEWLRDAGNERLAAQRPAALTSTDALAAFFEDCDARERDAEPEWAEHLAVMARSRGGSSSAP
jgi:hypothetical protein